MHTFIPGQRVKTPHGYGHILADHGRDGVRVCHSDVHGVGDGPNGEPTVELVEAAYVRPLRPWERWWEDLWT